MDDYKDTVALFIDKIENENPSYVSLTQEEKLYYWKCGYTHVFEFLVKNKLDAEYFKDWKKQDNNKNKKGKQK